MNLSGGNNLAMPYDLLTSSYFLWQVQDFSLFEVPVVAMMYTYTTPLHTQAIPLFYKYSISNITPQFHVFFMTDVPQLSSA
jgi:hypothetical protein